jgi:uncharacterized protein (DUF952 family)
VGRYIFHIALSDDWEEAKRAGEYRISTRGTTLDVEGFIHASLDREQVERVGAFNYATISEPLVVLKVDTERLDAPIRLENLDGGPELFPHIYGPIPVDAVVELLAATSDGRNFAVDWPDTD